jgi:hypothetical protein
MKKLILLAMVMFYFVIWSGSRPVKVSEYYQWNDWLIAKSVYSDTVYYIPLSSVVLIEKKVD